MRSLPVLVLMLATTLAPPLAFVKASDEPTRVVVAFHGAIPADVELRLAARGATMERRDDLLGFVVALTTDPQRVLSWTNVTDPQVRFTEIPGSLRLSDLGAASAEAVADPHTTFPNDPLYWRTQGDRSYQWGLHMVRAREAWNLTQGSHGVIVAVVDTGVDHTHPDIAANVARRLDGSVLGLDLRDGDGDPMDYHGHGTLIAGIVAARTDNGVGMAGMAQSRIMPIRVYDGLNQNTQDAAFAATGIAWAAANGARIITTSFHVVGEDATLRLAIQHAHALGATVIASAGNSFGGAVSRPAAYPEVIAVTALDVNGTAAAFAARGPEIDLAAPGGTGAPLDADDVLSLGLGGSYRFARGTSYSVGFVAGAGALALSARPVLTAPQLRQALEQTAVDTGPAGKDDLHGWGRVDARRAVERAMDLADTPGAPGSFTPP